MDQNGFFGRGKGRKGGGAAVMTIKVLKWELWENFSFNRKILKPCIPAQQDR